MARSTAGALVAGEAGSRRVGCAFGEATKCDDCPDHHDVKAPADVVDLYPVERYR
jgi:hypothetical protein